MKRIPFFVNLKHNANSKSYKEANPKLIRNIILQSANSFKYDGWNKKNFINSISAVSENFYSIFCLCIYRSEENNLFIFLDSGEKFSLNELFSLLKTKKIPLILLFIYCEDDESKIVQDLIKTSSVENCFCVVSTKDEQYFCFALACEIVNWWQLLSSKYDQVTFRHILECVKAVVKNYAKVCMNIFECSIIETSFISDDIAWRYGFNHAVEVDVEKVRSRARNEQTDDTIKRIFDCANSTREEHLETNKRLVSSQGLFWLSETEDINDLKDWIVDTRFFKDIAPYVHDYNSIGIRKITKKFVQQTFLQDLEQDFLFIPTDEYKFGISHTLIESEPPANFYSGILNEFKILRYPVTEKLWSQIISGENLSNSLLPKVDINYFEAVTFIQILNDLFHEYKPVEFESLILKLPSEYQWEAAAKGKTAYNYPWGNEFESTNCNCEMMLRTRSEVGGYSKNGDSVFGCQDMAGNVREWTRSYGGTRGVDWQWHSEKSFKEMYPQIKSYSRMIIKGGSYSYSSDCVQNWVRNTQIAIRRDKQTGFRIVIENAN